LQKSHCCWHALKIHRPVPQYQGQFVGASAVLVTTMVVVVLVAHGAGVGAGGIVAFGHGVFGIVAFGSCQPPHPD